MKKIFILVIIIFIFLSLSCDITVSQKNTFLFSGNVVDATYGYYLHLIYVDYEIYDVKDKLIYVGGILTNEYGYFEIYGKHNEAIEDLYKLELHFYSDYYVTQRNTSYYNQWRKNGTNVSYKSLINLNRRYK